MTQRSSPFDRLIKSQRAAVGKFTDAALALVEAGKTGVTQPDEVVRQVASMARALGDIAGSSAKPVETLLNSQRQLAETMAAFAVIQRQLADVLDAVAANHAAVVDAIEALANPLLGVAESLRTERSEDDGSGRRPARKRAPSGSKPAKSGGAAGKPRKSSRSSTPSE